MRTPRKRATGVAAASIVTLASVLGAPATTAQAQCTEICTVSVPGAVGRDTALLKITALGNPGAAFIKVTGSNAFLKIAGSNAFLKIDGRNAFLKSNTSTFRK